MMNQHFAGCKTEFFLHVIHVNLHVIPDKDLAAELPDKDLGVGLRAAGRCVVVWGRRRRRREKIAFGYAFWVDLL